MAWNQLFGGGHPYGTYANMADRYPADMAREQNRDIGLGAIMPFANLMRPTVDAAKAVYNWLPDSSTTQMEKLRANQLQNLAGSETNPYVRNALSPPSLPAPQPSLRPSNLPRTDQEFISSLPKPSQNIGDSAYGNPEIPGVNKVAGQSGGISSLPAPPAATPRSDVSSSVPPDRIPGMIQAGQRYGLSQQGYSPIPETDWMRQVAPAAGFGPGNPNRQPGPGQSAGSTNYRMPGQYAMGGTEPGYATFQGIPKPGGSFGYVGTPETQNMTQEQATAYNVGNINRQIEALRSEREAYNPGGSLGVAQQDYGNSLPSPSSSNPYEMPGDNRLDTAVRQQTIEKALSRALDPRSGMTARRRQTALDAARMFSDRDVAGQRIGAEQWNAAAQRESALRNALLEYTQRQQGMDWENQKLGAATAADLQKQWLAAAQADRDFNLRQQQAINLADLQGIQAGKSKLDIKNMTETNKLITDWQAATDPKVKAQLQQAIELRRRGSINPQEMFMQPMAGG